MKSVVKTKVAQQKTNMVGNLDLGMQMQAKMMTSGKQVVAVSREACCNLRSLSSLFMARVGFTHELLESSLECRLQALK